jgi:hypothetical protein
MKKTMVFACVCMICSAVLADVVDEAHRVQWLSSVTEGFYNDAANWTGGEVPANGIDGKYGYINFQTNDVTIKAPPGVSSRTPARSFSARAMAHTRSRSTRAVPTGRRRA